MVKIERKLRGNSKLNLFDDVLVIIVMRLLQMKIVVKYIFDDANYQTGTDRIARVASKTAI